MHHADHLICARANVHLNASDSNIQPDVLCVQCAQPGQAATAAPFITTIGRDVCFSKVAYGV